MWSQCPWVETISLSVQSRAASSSAIQARLGVAVSIAIASRVRGSASTWTLVAIGPTTRSRCSTRSVLGLGERTLHAELAVPLADRCRRERSVGVGRQAPPSSFVLMQSKVWPIILFAVPSISRAPTLASVPEMLTSAFQSMTVPPSVAVGQAHLGGRVDGTAGRLAVGLDRRARRAASARRTPCSR